MEGREPRGRFGMRKEFSSPFQEEEEKKRKKKGVDFLLCHDVDSM